MTDDDARDWVAAAFPDALAVLERLVSMVVDENGRQNLVARSTTAMMWSRHVADSLQLVRLAADRVGGRWLDIGTGGGFPGLVISAVWKGEVVLVEPRRRRAEFLTRAAEALRLDHVDVRCARIEAVRTCADIISARAVAPVVSLVAAACHVAGDATRWLLPRGRAIDADVAGLRHGKAVFHVEQSLTEATSSVIVIDQLGRMP